MSNISRGDTSHQTGTVPLCSMTGATSSIDRTSISVLRVVDGVGVGRADCEAEAVNRRGIAHRLERVHRHGRDVHEVTLRDHPLLALDLHDPAPRCDVIELVRRVVVRIDIAAAGDFELADEFEVAAL